jgi:hypothetical protein
VCGRDGIDAVPRHLDIAVCELRADLNGVPNEGSTPVALVEVPANGDSKGPTRVRHHPRGASAGRVSYTAGILAARPFGL